MVVPRAPKIPGVAPHDLLRRQGNAAVHRLEDVRGDLREIGGGLAGQLGFIFRHDRFFFPPAAGDQEKRHDEGERADEISLISHLVSPSFPGFSHAQIFHGRHREEEGRWAVRRDPPPSSHGDAPTALPPSLVGLMPWGLADSLDLSKSTVRDKINLPRMDGIAKDCALALVNDPAAAGLVPWRVTRPASRTAFSSRFLGAGELRSRTDRQN